MRITVGMKAKPGTWERVTSSRMLLVAATVWLKFFLIAQAQVQTNDCNVQTFAGSDYGHLDGQGTDAMFHYPDDIVADTSGNLYVLDWDDVLRQAMIRKITPVGMVSTLVTGLNTLGGEHMVMDRSNVIWIALWQGYALKLTTKGQVLTANLPYATGAICFDSTNNLYYASQNIIFRRSTNGTEEVFAGSGNDADADGHGTLASLSHPYEMAADASNNIYVFETTGRFRRINQNRDVVTLWTNQTFYAMCFDNTGTLVTAFNTSIGLLSLTNAAGPSPISLAGGQDGYLDGPGSLARFSSVYGVCFSQGTIYAADGGNHKIRSVFVGSNQPPPWPAHLGMALFAGPTGRLKLSGAVGQTYSIESSTNMTGWATETTIPLGVNPFYWFDQTPLGEEKFYRALLQP